VPRVLLQAWQLFVCQKVGRRLAWLLHGSVAQVELLGTLLRLLRLLRRCVAKRSWASQTDSLLLLLRR
jgi:hypothetical protein